ncbi:MAG TPA: protein TolR [Verrucomicrobiae bacterium]|nr:protein TolR [Verrucomicrobiae bacterium]
MQVAAPKRKRRRLASEINVVPYIDVMLVLLIIFMITAPLLTQGVEVNLPETTADSLATPSEPVTLSIDAKGRYYVDIGEATGKPVSDDELIRRVGVALKRKPDEMILIRADARVDYGRVAFAMGLLQEAGASKIGFASDPLPPKGEAAARK